MPLIRKNGKSNMINQVLQLDKVLIVKDAKLILADLSVLAEMRTLYDRPVIESEVCHSTKNKDDASDT